MKTNSKKQKFTKKEVAEELNRRHRENVRLCEEALHLMSSTSHKLSSLLLKLRR